LGSERRTKPGGEVEKALSDVEALYTGNLEQHGLDSKAVGWPDDASHLLRFQKLAHVIEADPPAEPYSVNDWGCGYGAMFGFLDGLAGVELGSYRGYDISAEMIEAARRNIDDPRAEFVEDGTVDRDADYTFVSGTFNVRAEATDEAWGEFVKEKLREIAARSRRGFAFNLLTTYVDWRKDDLFYADPTEFFTFCRENLSRYVTLLHDYPLYEWTIAVLHERGEDDQ
jgi:SAM-dependent methyltransferase